VPREKLDPVFLGQYRHTVDKKGRMVLPARFRESLTNGCVITKGQERCLYVFPIDRWEEEAEKYRKLPRTDARARRLTRAFFAGAIDQEMDGAGRIQLPVRLRDYAGLTRDVTVVGVEERAEIWDSAAWDRYDEEADNYYSNIEEALSEFGI
jgi:MraZ protein